MRGPMRALGAVLLLASAVVVADPNPEAEKLFRDGRALLKTGDLAAACDAFAASSKLGPSVGTFLNLGDCRVRLGQVASAWAAFVEAGRLAGKEADPRKAEADKRASELEPQLSYVTIDAPSRVPGMSVVRDGTAIDPAAWGQPIAVDPGGHTIVASAPGFDTWSTTIAIKAQGDRGVAHVPALHAHPAAPAPAPVTMVVPTSKPLTSTRVAGLAIGGAGIVAGGVAVGLAFSAKSLSDSAHLICPAGMPCHDLAASQQADRAVSRANTATIVGIVGAAAVATGVVLWVVGHPHADETHVVPIATREGAAVTVVGTF